MNSTGKISLNCSQIMSACELSILCDSDKFTCVLSCGKIKSQCCCDWCIYRPYGCQFHGRKIGSHERFCHYRFLLSEFQGDSGGQGGDGGVKIRGPKRKMKKKPYGLTKGTGTIN